MFPQMFLCFPTHDLWKHCCGNKICFPILITATVTVSGVMIGGGGGGGGWGGGGGGGGGGRGLLLRCRTGVGRVVK